MRHEKHVQACGDSAFTCLTPSPRQDHHRSSRHPKRKRRRRQKCHAVQCSRRPCFARRKCTRHGSQRTVPSLLSALLLLMTWMPTAPCAAMPALVIEKCARPGCQQGSSLPPPLVLRLPRRLPCPRCSRGPCRSCCGCPPLPHRGCGDAVGTGPNVSQRR